MLQDFFNKHDVQAISKILLPYFTEDDKLIWTLTKNGRYSVKFGYRVACNISQVGLRREMSEGWKKIWHLSVPPKVKVFVW